MVIPTTVHFLDGAVSLIEKLDYCKNISGIQPLERTPETYRDRTNHFYLHKQNLFSKQSLYLGQRPCFKEGRLISWPLCQKNKVPSKFRNSLIASSYIIIIQKNNWRHLSCDTCLGGHTLITLAHKCTYLVCKMLTTVL